MKRTGLYKAYEYGLEYIDGDTDEQMTFNNIIVLTTSISVIDDVGRLSVKLTGTGDGYFICGGKWTPITWQRDSNYEAFTYYLGWNKTELRHWDAPFIGSCPKPRFGRHLKNKLM
jgi:hypothetical protein